MSDRVVATGLRFTVRDDLERAHAVLDVMPKLNDAVHWVLSAREQYWDGSAMVNVTLSDGELEALGRWALDVFERRRRHLAEKGAK